MKLIVFKVPETGHALALAERRGFDVGHGVAGVRQGRERPRRDDGHLLLDRRNFADARTAIDLLIDVREIDRKSLVNRPQRLHPLRSFFSFFFFHFFKVLYNVLVITLIS